VAVFGVTGVPAGFAVRPARKADFPDILRLNTEWVHFTSHLDAVSLAKLHAQSPHHRVVVSRGRVVAFLLAMREGSDYASVNYRWFDDRGGPFLYVDRVVVGSSDQGKGIAQMLYDDLLVYARGSGVVSVVCELDVDPPNEASRRFHDGYGFAEVGTQWVANGAKRVSLRELRVCDVCEQAPLADDVEQAL
jgi:predicted GNAT superfamily acetyltransferase